MHPPRFGQGRAAFVLLHGASGTRMRSSFRYALDIPPEVGSRPSGSYKAIQELGSGLHFARQTARCQIEPP